jgi:vancomycin resistance protein YoaR
MLNLNFEATDWALGKKHSGIRVNPDATISLVSEMAFRLLTIFATVLATMTLWGCKYRRPVTMATFRTSLEGRTEGQKLNATKAARAVDGAVIPSSSTFSFNQRVGSWTRERGFVRAPVSLGGVLVPSWGGGVCQVSTTLYVAALLAGLEVLERHHHAVAPSYVPKGMDAAVAYGVADLRLRNPFPFPVQIRFEVSENQLTCHVIGFMTPRQERDWKRLKFQIRRETLSPQQVRLWRMHYRDGKLVRRELCNESTYMH